VAESSVTIDGIVYVIDSCYQKVKVYDYKRSINHLFYKLRFGIIKCFTYFLTIWCLKSRKSWKNKRWNLL